MNATLFCACKASKYVKNRETKARIRKALEPIKTEE
jgi:hypothetical protein